MLFGGFACTERDIVISSCFLMVEIQEANNYAIVHSDITDQLYNHLSSIQLD